jgi:hypothetical protein
MKLFKSQIVPVRAHLNSERAPLKRSAPRWIQRGEAPDPQIQIQIQNGPEG